MQQTFKILIFAFTAFLFTSCGEKTIDYSDWIVGDWVLKNAGELQRYLPPETKVKRTFLLKNATISFKSNGTVNTKLMKLDKKNWIEQTGTWEMPERGGAVSIKSDKGPFDDKLEIEFPDERTFYLKSNQLVYHFVKL